MLQKGEVDCAFENPLAEKEPGRPFYLQPFKEKQKSLKAGKETGHSKEKKSFKTLPP